MIDPRVTAALDWLGDAQTQLMIGNASVPASEAIASISPSTGKAFAEIGLGDAGAIDAAVMAARSALDGEWGGALPSQRARALLRLADLIDAHTPHIAALEAADGVRPFVEAVYGDVPTGAAVFRYFAGLAGAIEGSVKYPSIGYAPPGTRVRALIDKYPVGVVGAIVPWNVPFIMACARLAPALAAGCTVVLKPAEDTSLSALALGKLIVEAGFPPGVVAIVPGRGDVAGAALVAHAGIDKISFTGSTRVGRAIGAACGAAMKKHALELGGKSAAIVMDDADIDAAVAGLAGAAFGNAGQICVSAARILAHASVHDALVERLSASAATRRPGGNFDETATIGPIVSATQHARIGALIDDARSGGAQVSADHAVSSDGYFVQPVVVSNLATDARMAHEETFGPAVVVEAFDDLDDAIVRANDTVFGLAASIWTARWRDADCAGRALKSGTIYVNCHAFADPAVPMGGMKASGIGVESGREGLEGYLMTKTMLAVL